MVHIFQPSVGDQTQVKLDEVKAIPVYMERTRTPGLHRNFDFTRRRRKDGL